MFFDGDSTNGRSISTKYSERTLKILEICLKEWEIGIFDKIFEKKIDHLSIDWHAGVDMRWDQNFFVHLIWEEIGNCDVAKLT